MTQVVVHSGLQTVVFASAVDAHSIGEASFPLWFIGHFFDRSVVQRSEFVACRNPTNRPAFRCFLLVVQSFAGHAR